MIETLSRKVGEKRFRADGQAKRERLRWREPGQARVLAGLLSSGL
jgi:hypothetical protein